MPIFGKKNTKENTPSSKLMTKVDKTPKSYNLEKARAKAGFSQRPVETPTDEHLNSVARASNATGKQTAKTERIEDKLRAFHKNLADLKALLEKVDWKNYLPRKQMNQVTMDALCAFLAFDHYFSHHVKDSKSLASRNLSSGQSYKDEMTLAYGKVMIEVAQITLKEFSKIANNAIGLNRIDNRFRENFPEFPSVISVVSERF